jgi:hypothetical protein
VKEKCSGGSIRNVVNKIGITSGKKIFGESGEKARCSSHETEPTEKKHTQRDWSANLPIGGVRNLTNSFVLVEWRAIFENPISSVQ